MYLLYIHDMIKLKIYLFFQIHKLNSVRIHTHTYSTFKCMLLNF